MRRGLSWALLSLLLPAALGSSIGLRADPPPRAGVPGVIEGRVFDPERRPAAGVEVQALAAPEPFSWFDDPELDRVLAPAAPGEAAVLASTHTGNDGAFVLTGLLPHRRYRVRTVSVAPLVSSARLAMAEPEPAGSVGLYLARGAPLRLQLVGLGGAGVPGRISLRPNGAWYPGSGEVLGHEGGPSLSDLATSADGSLTVAAVPSGTFVLTAVSPGRGALTRIVRTPTEEVLVLALSEGQGGRLQGRVRDEEGRGVVGARLVWSLGEYAERRWCVATTDAGGGFRLDELPEGPARLARVEAPGGLGRSQDSIVLVPAFAGVGAGQRESTQHHRIVARGEPALPATDQPRAIIVSGELQPLHEVLENEAVSGEVQVAATLCLGSDTLLRGSRAA